MYKAAILLLALCQSAVAAPAVVWKSAQDTSTAAHSSTGIEASKVLENVLAPEASDSALAAVVFLVARGDNGSETFSTLASAGSLPGVASHYENAHTIHHHVSGLSNSATIVHEAVRVNPGHSVLEVSLQEFSEKLRSFEEPSEEAVINSSTGKLLTKTEKAVGKRTRLMASANVLVVNVGAKTDPAEIDAAVVKAIESKTVKNVVLAGARSVDEVKLERDMLARRRMLSQHQGGKRSMASQRRRLEEGNANDDGAAEEVNTSGRYYVNMTPNILAGLLFTLMFAVVTYTGITCMGMIAGPDVYVSKLPPIGREA